MDSWSRNGKITFYEKWKDRVFYPNENICFDSYITYYLLSNLVPNMVFIKDVLRNIYFPLFVCINVY